jgi:opacity protein-like surface antigen
MERLSLKLAAIGAALLTSVGALPAAAGEGYFAGIGVPQLSLEGDFDGETFVLGARSGDVAPRWEKTTGYRVTGGFRDRNFYYVGSYTEADLDGAWRGLGFEGKYRSLFAEAAYVFLPRKVHPYVGGGIGISRVKVANGSTDGVNLGDSEYRGDFKYRLGAGVLFDVGRSLSLDLQVAKLFGEYADLNGLEGGELRGFDADGSAVSLSLQYYVGY